MGKPGAASALSHQITLYESCWQYGRVSCDEMKLNSGHWKGTMAALRDNEVVEGLSHFQHPKCGRRLSAANRRPFMQ